MLEHFLANVEQAGSLGTQQPFVSACGVEISAGIMEAERNHAGGMGAIQHIIDIFIAANFC